MGIHSDIARLQHKIRECESGISELGEARDFLRQKYTIIQNEAYEPAKNYDITCGEQFRGKLEEMVESDRYNIITKTRESQNATLEFISQIDVTIERLHEMIHEYEREIDHLERELRAREASQNRE